MILNLFAILIYDILICLYDTRSAYDNHLSKITIYDNHLSKITIYDNVVMIYDPYNTKYNKNKTNTN